MKWIIAVFLAAAAAVGWNVFQQARADEHRALSLAAEANYVAGNVPNTDVEAEVKAEWRALVQTLCSSLLSDDGAGAATQRMLAETGEFVSPDLFGSPAVDALQALGEDVRIVNVQTGATVDANALGDLLTYSVQLDGDASVLTVFNQAGCTSF